MPEVDNIEARLNKESVTLNRIANQDMLVETEAGQRKSLPMLSREINDNLNNSGLMKPVTPWLAGITVTDPLQLYSSGGVDWRPQPSQVPFDTGAVFDVSQFAVWRGMTVDDLGDLALLRAPNLEAAKANPRATLGKKIKTEEYYSGSGVGGDEYVVVDDNPGSLGVLNHAKTDGSGLFLKLLHDGVLDLLSVGLGVNTGVDDSVIINIVLADLTITEYILPLAIRIENPLRLRDFIKVRGGGVGRYEGGSTLACINTSPWVLDDDTSSLTGVELRGVTITGDRSSDYMYLAITSGFGDWRWCQVSNCQVTGFLDVQLRGTGTIWSGCNFDENITCNLEGGDNIFRGNFFNSKFESGPGAYAVKFGSNNTVYEGNYLTAGEHPLVADNPDCVFLEGCQSSSIVNNWFDFGGQYCVRVGYLAEGVIFTGNKIDGGVDSTCTLMRFEGVKNFVASGNILKRGSVGYDLLVDSSSIVIENTLYMESLDHRIVGGGDCYDITVNDRFAQVFSLKSLPDDNVKSWLRGCVITNDNAVGEVFALLPTVNVQVGDTYNFRRTASEDFTIFGVYTLTSGGPQGLSVRYDGSAWVRSFTDSILPTASTGLVAGEVWNDAGTLMVV